MKIGNNIKFYRKQKGLTQSQLAEMLNVSTITIQNYENNRRKPSIETLTKIAKALDIPVSKLIEDDKFKKQTESSNMKEKIKFYREKLNMSKSELARQIGVSPSYITMLENGDKSNPSMEILLKISKVLNIDITELSYIDDSIYKILSDYRAKEINELSDIGDNIKKYRKLAHMTQVELAQKINKSESTIRKYEANNVKPNFSVLDDIANVLGCTRIDLVNNTDIPVNSIFKSDYLEQYIKFLGYEINRSLLSEGHIVINAPDGTYEITEKDLEELETTTKSFVLFKIQEIIKNSRKSDK